MFHWLMPKLVITSPQLVITIRTMKYLGKSPNTPRGWSSGLGVFVMQRQSTIALYPGVPQCACLCANVEALDITIGNEARSFSFPSGAEYVAFLFPASPHVAKLTRRNRQCLDALARVVAVDAEEERQNNGGLGPESFDLHSIKWSARRAENVILWAGGTSQEIDQLVAKAVGSAQRLLIVMAREAHLPSWMKAIFPLVSPQAVCSVFASAEMVRQLVRDQCSFLFTRSWNQT
jgi:hypothetical protein